MLIMSNFAFCFDWVNLFIKRNVTIFACFCFVVQNKYEINDVETSNDI